MSRRPRARIEIEGLRDARRAIRRVSDDSKTELRGAHRAVSEIVARQAKIEVPVRSGRLRASIRAGATTTRGQVKAGGYGIRYAGPVHFGWSSRPNTSRGWRGGPIAPQPFIYEAADRRIRDVLDEYERQMGAIIRRHGLDD